MILFLFLLACAPADPTDTASGSLEAQDLIAEHFPCFEVEADPADLTYMAEIPYSSHVGDAEYVLDEDSIELDLKALMQQADGSYLWVSSREGTYTDWVLAEAYDPSYSFLYWRGSPEGCALTVYTL